MKYTCTIIIDLPIAKVVALWKDENNFKHWQDGFESITLISGSPEQEGAQSKILLKNKGQAIELIETIIKSNLPVEKIGLYEHKHMTNTQSSRFESIDPNGTKYTSEVEYIQFNGILIKLIAKLFPSKFKQQSQKWMVQFKEFAENHG